MAKLVVPQTSEEVASLVGAVVVREERGRAVI
jgi:hypothetical protein